MHITRPVAVASFAATALAGGIGGAVLLGTASAGTSTGVTSAEVREIGRVAGCGDGFAELAAAVGVSTEDLRAALREGRTLAEVAEANDVDPQTLVDVLVANGTERLDAAVAAGRIEQSTADERAAELPVRATELVDGELELDRDTPRRPRAAIGLRTTAEAIGISADDLRAALQDGQTIAQVAEANGVDPQTVVDSLVARSTDRITRVVNGETARARC